jgi:hypothetical protein
MPSSGMFTPCGSCKNRQFGGTYLSMVFLRSVFRLVGTANVVPSSPILVTLMMETYVPPKRQFLQEPHDVTSQKTAFLIVTAVKMSNLTKFMFTPCSRFLSLTPPPTVYHGHILLPAAWKGTTYLASSSCKRELVHVQMHLGT